MKISEFIEKIESGEAKVLTLKEAKNLIGKEIYWCYFGYEHNENKVSTLKVGNIVSEKEYYTTIDNSPVEGFANRFEYWVSKVPSAAKKAEKNLMILDENNKMTYIYCHKDNPYYKEQTFTCSDMDREVYFMLAE